MEIKNVEQIRARAQGTPVSTLSWDAKITKSASKFNSQLRKLLENAKVGSTIKLDYTLRNGSVDHHWATKINDDSYTCLEDCWDEKAGAYVEVRKPDYKGTWALDLDYMSFGATSNRVDIRRTRLAYNSLNTYGNTGDYKVVACDLYLYEGDENND